MFKKYIYHGENFVISLEQLLSSKISLKREITNLKLRRSKPDKEKEYDLFDTRLAAAFILDNRIATTTKDGLEIHDQDILNIIKEFLDFLKKYIPQKIDKARSQRGMFSFELTSDD
jgi:hypothetical protein